MERVGEGVKCSLLGFAWLSVSLLLVRKQKCDSICMQAIGFSRFLLFLAPIGISPHPGDKLLIDIL